MARPSTTQKIVNAPKRIANACFTMQVPRERHKASAWERPLLRPRWPRMDQKLHSRSVLIVEREELIAMVIARAFEDAGATVTTCSNVKDAMAMLDRGMFSAAVLDHMLFHGKERHAFDERGIPYVLHNGLVEMHGTRGDAVDVLPKPVDADALVDAVAKLTIRRV